MSVEVKEVPESKLVEVHLTGKLTKEDYEHFVPIVESRIAESGKIRLLVVMNDFHGWTASALWQDIKFDTKHFSDIERLAIVGESKWEKGMAAFCRPFTTATLKYFDIAKLQEAHDWIRATD